MRGDWQGHFLGWHFFRREPWQFPPGAITGLYEPIGTSLGYMDSIPAAAFLLKPVEGWLPDPFQYLGLWFLVCFILQGVFGALVVSAWTARSLLQVTGAMLLVLLPPLLFRAAHPALASHWLLLWALWLYWRPATSAASDRAQHAALGLVSGLVHPYLAAMVLGLLAALTARRLLEGDWRRAATSGPLAVVAVASGWWASGLFTLSRSQDLLAAGSDFSVNLLSLLNPGPNSSFLPGFRFLSGNQWDAYSYLGLGGLAVCAAAGVLAFRQRPWSRATTPLVAVLLVFALYAMMPVIAAGPFVLLDLRDELGAVNVFRATGRFFWPVTYALVAAAIGVAATCVRPTMATAILVGALALQIADLHEWWLQVHDGARKPEPFEWRNTMPSPEWHELLPQYRHLRLYSPAFCHGEVPVSPAVAAFHAGLFGLGINDGYAARVDAVRQDEACRQLRADFDRGAVDDSTVYLLAPSYVSRFKQHTGEASDCREIDAVTVCVRAESAVPRP